MPVAIRDYARISLIRRHPTSVSHGRGHWFDPSTAHHSETLAEQGSRKFPGSRLGRAWRVRQFNRESFTDGCRSLLYGLEQHVGVLWIEQSLKLAAASPHPFSGIPRMLAPQHGARLIDVLAHLGFASALDRLVMTDEATQLRSLAVQPGHRQREPQPAAAAARASTSSGSSPGLRSHTAAANEAFSRHKRSAASRNRRLALRCTVTRSAA